MIHLLEKAIGAGAHYRPPRRDDAALFAVLSTLVSTAGLAASAKSNNA